MSGGPNPTLTGAVVVLGLGLDVALGVHGLGAAAVAGAIALTATSPRISALAMPIATGLHVAAALTFGASPSLDPTGSASGWAGAALSAGLVLAVSATAWWRRRTGEAERKALAATIDELDAKRVAAEGASRLRVREFATMSHEIRTPLNGIIGMARLLQDDALSPTAAERVDVLHGSAESLLRIVNDVVDLGRIESGKLEIAHAPFDIRTLARDVITMADAVARPKGIAVYVDLDEELTPIRRGDAGRIRQICVNLIHNAIKFTDHGSVTLVVRAQSHDRVRLAVRDTGQGMDSEKAHEMFRTFAKSGGSGGGAGLGLAIVRELVKLMGGRLSVETNLGRGSVFACVIPLPPATTPSMELPHDVDDQLGGYRVLVADDNPVNRMVAVGLLSKAGATTLEVENGREAHDRALTGGIDLILMDVEMPEMTGFEATRALRSQGITIPIIGLTAHVGSEQRQRCLDAGMNEHLAKPFKAAELVGAIQRHVPPRVEA